MTTVEQDGLRLCVSTLGVGNVVPQVINIVSRDGELRSIAVREPTLDEVFLHLTGKAVRD